MEQTTRFLTVKKEDLFDLTERLVHAIEADVLLDRKHPLLISVNGSKESGKRIIFEAAANALCGNAPKKSGHPSSGEFWSGRLNNHPFEVGYIDTAYGAVHCSSHEVLVRAMTQPRRTSGLRVIQNAIRFGEKAGISIWIEKHIDWPQSFRNSAAIMQQFSKIAQIEPWSRCVEVTVRDTRLLKSKQFSKTFNTFAPVEYQVPESFVGKARKFMGLFLAQPFYPPYQDQELPVYGQGYPAAQSGPSI